jgi:hypothetical protein
MEKWIMTPAEVAQERRRLSLEKWIMTPAEVAQERRQLSPGRVPGCPTCEANPSGMMPPHYASARCESGGRNHCTCKECFD